MARDSKCGAEKRMIVPVDRGFRGAIYPNGPPAGEISSLSRGGSACGRLAGHAKLAGFGSIAGCATRRRCRGRSAGIATAAVALDRKQIIGRGRDNGHAPAPRPRDTPIAGMVPLGPSIHIVEWMWSWPCRTSSTPCCFSSAQQLRRIGQPLGARIRAQRMMDQQHAKRLLGGEPRQQPIERIELACVRASPSPSAAASAPPTIRRSAPAGRAGAGREMRSPRRARRRRAR